MNYSLSKSESTSNLKIQHFQFNLGWELTMVKPTVVW